MTAARLSPAASLLRNSKLFALPPSLALPAIEPSSEPVARSDTATTLYPTRAAIETHVTSLNKGDWGFKRPLPLKSTTKTSNPVVRLNRGIDTAEHIADFDSATDHVLTLRKFQELNQSIRRPTLEKRDETSAFNSSFDNVTESSAQTQASRNYTGVWPDIAPSETSSKPRQATEARSSFDFHAEYFSRKPKTPAVASSVSRRWRHKGPSLVQMSGLQFEEYLQSLDMQKREDFRAKVKKTMILEQTEKANAAARDAGTVGEESSTAIVSDDDVSEYLRRLRHQPEKLGSLIADFLDLPEGPDRITVSPRSTTPAGPQWEYGRETMGSGYYQLYGPPKTHPSAGLSYIHNQKFAHNDAIFGPQNHNVPAVARQVKTRSKVTTLRNTANYGLAGFIINQPEVGESVSTLDSNGFEPTAGGQKVVVRPSNAIVTEQGATQISAVALPQFKIHQEKAVHGSLMPQSANSVAQRRTPTSRILGPPAKSSVTGMNYRRRSEVKSDEQVDDLFALLQKS